MNKVRCQLCPRECLLDVGETGDCRVRLNKDGELISLVYGKPCAVHIDPIEKKPMNHFLPGSRAFSIATAGCNLHCKFCQNWEISQRGPDKTRNIDLPPKQVVDEAIRASCRSIAYTYSDPTIFYEYVLDTSEIARNNDINNVWVTAAYLKQDPLIRACELMDGANVDLKGNEEYYKNICSAHLKPIQDSIKTMVKKGVIVEITHLIVPTLNDNREDTKELIKWVLGEVGPDIPLHFSRFTPMYKLTHLYPTPKDTLINAAEMATDMGVHYAYVGNIATERWESTRCPECKKTIIKRRGYLILENLLEHGRCKYCKTKIYGKWE